jgi:Gram-negative porin
VPSGRFMAVIMGGGAAALALAFTPALSAPGDLRVVKPRLSQSPRSDLGTFTPANGDPRLAAVLARSGLGTSGFRFTPATTSVKLGRSVTVAVRARNGLSPVLSERAALVSPSQGSGMTALTPIAYNLGVAVGWRRFAVSSEVAKVDLGALGGREAVDLGVSYTARKFSTRVAVGADHATPGTPRALAQGSNGYTFDVGGSYRLSRNLDLTAGVRYRASERDRLAPLADNRRDSQAVYVGTAFKF